MDRKAAIAIVGLGAGALVLFARKSKAATRPLTTAQPGRAKVDRNFKVGRFFVLREFLVSKTFPELAGYDPTAQELSNLQTLTAEILDPARDLYGVILVNNGGRPPSIAAARGTTWKAKLTEKGYKPAENYSDHEHFGAADISFPKISDEKWLTAYQQIAAFPKARQVILYTKTGTDGKIHPSHLHVSVVLPGYPKMPPSKQSFVVLDNKQVKKPVA